MTGTNGMNHLDEGTIHAWLDGALDAGHARDVETHVAGCGTCAAALADARGLIAATSRILVALDDVPVGVIPKRAPMPGDATLPRRQWRAARWVTGVAAALMLAVGVTTWNRDAVKREMAPTGTSATMEPLRAVELTQAPPVALPPEQARETAARDGVARTGAQKLVDVAGTTSSTPSRTADAVGATPAAAAEAAAAQPSPAAPLAVRRDRAAEPVDANALAGCYRTDAGAAEARQRSDDPREAAASPNAGAAPPATGALRKSAAGAPADNRAQSMAGAATLHAPGVVRLDTLRSAAGYVARSPASSAAVGSWTPVGRDSVRVDLQGAGVFTFAGSARTVCP